MEHHGTAGIGMSGGGAIERRFKRSQKRARRSLIRPPSRGGRHGATPELKHHLLQDLAIPGNVPQVDGLERQSSSFQFLTVASDTILFEKRRAFDCSSAWLSKQLEERRGPRPLSRPAYSKNFLDLLLGL